MTHHRVHAADGRVRRVVLQEGAPLPELRHEVVVDMRRHVHPSRRGPKLFFTHVACGLDTGVSVGGGPADRAGPIGSGAGARVGHLPAFARAPAPGAPQKFRRTEAGCAPRAQTAAEEYVRKALREPGGAVVVGEGGATGKDRGPDACLCTKADAAPPLLSAFSAQALRAWARRGRVESCLSREAVSLGGGDGSRIGVLRPLL